MSDWPVRISAAIEKAEGLFPAAEESTQEEFVRADYDEYRRRTVTKTEVALAKALWENQPQQHAQDATGSCNWCQALRDFVMKVEAI